MSEEEKKPIDTGKSGSDKSTNKRSWIGENKGDIGGLQKGFEYVPPPKKESGNSDKGDKK